jgi:hypothetical protein
MFVRVSARQPSLLLGAFQRAQPLCGAKGGKAMDVPSRQEGSSLPRMFAPYLFSTWPYATPFVEINQPFFHSFLHKNLIETPKPNPVRRQAFCGFYQRTEILLELIF